jgi:hypothetical protein
MVAKLCRSAAWGVAALCLLPVAALPLLAQSPGADGPPPVLVINREFLKPGRGGSIHEKTEAAFLAAAKAGKAPFHYFALTSMTGADRALFLSAYPSFAAIEDEGKLGDKNPALGAALDHAMVADGDLLASTDSSNWIHRPELSLNESNLVGVRYFEIQQVMVKPGHMKQVDEWVKMYVAGYRKVPGANWATYQQVYGTNSNSFLFITLLKSLSDTDNEFGASSKAFETAMGESQMKKLSALEAEVVDTEMTNVFRISPKMSLPMEEMVKAEPDFWKPKPALAAKAAAKPAAKPAP